MTFTMKEEEFFEKYLKEVVKEDSADKAKSEITRLFAAVNTKDPDLKQVEDSNIPALLSHVKPEFKEDTQKILLKWLHDKA